MQPSQDGSRGEPGAAERAWIAAARAVREHAYSPYSGVRVGALLASADGRLFAGCNVENASYGLTICAERSALVQAVSAGVRAFEALVIVANRAEPLMPCGACRQMLSEFGGELRVLCFGDGGRSFETSLRELLPSAFGRADLELPDLEPTDGGEAGA